MKAIQSIYLVGLVSIMGLFCIKLAQAFPDKALNSNSFNEENSSLDNFESSFSPIGKYTYLFFISFLNKNNSFKIKSVSICVLNMVVWLQGTAIVYN